MRREENREHGRVESRGWSRKLGNRREAIVGDGEEARGPLQFLRYSSRTYAEGFTTSLASVTFVLHVSPRPAEFRGSEFPLPSARNITRRGAICALAIARNQAQGKKGVASRPAGVVGRACTAGERERERIDEGGEDALSLFLSPSRNGERGEGVSAETEVENGGGRWWKAPTKEGGRVCGVVVARASERRRRWKGIV